MSKPTSASGGGTLTRAKCHHARLREHTIRSGPQTVAGELRGHVRVKAQAPDLGGAWHQAEDVSFAPAVSAKAKFIGTRVESRETGSREGFQSEFQS